MAIHTHLLRLRRLLLLQTRVRLNRLGHRTEEGMRTSERVSAKGVVMLNARYPLERENRAGCWIGSFDLRLSELARESLVLHPSA